MTGQERQEISTEKRKQIQVLPFWEGAMRITPLKGGISNESWLVCDDQNTFVVRFGEDYPFHHVDRAYEAMVAHAAHQAGFAPALIHAEKGMMVSEFLRAQTFDAEIVRANISDIAELARNFHQSMPYHVIGPARMFWVFHVIRDYARILRRDNSRYVAVLTDFLRDAEKLEAIQVSLPIIFSHNDLLPANILKSDNRLWLIDFEYTGFSTAMFDLAGLASNAAFDHAQSNELLGLYFDKTPTKQVVQSHDAMQCASLLREAMWSMVSELYLAAPSVNYGAYTSEQLALYRAKLDHYQTRYGKL